MAGVRAAGRCVPGRAQADGLARLRLADACRRGGSVPGRATPSRQRDRPDHVLIRAFLWAVYVWRRGSIGRLAARSPGGSCPSERDRAGSTGVPAPSGCAWAWRVSYAGVLYIRARGQRHAIVSACPHPPAGVTASAVRGHRATEAPHGRRNVISCADHAPRRPDRTQPRPGAGPCR